MTGIRTSIECALLPTSVSVRLGSGAAGRTTNASPFCTPQSPRTVSTGRRSRRHPAQPRRADRTRRSRPHPTTDCGTGTRAKRLGQPRRHGTEHQSGQREHHGDRETGANPRRPYSPAGLSDDERDRRDAVACTAVSGPGAIIDTPHPPPRHDLAHPSATGPLARTCGEVERSEAFARLGHRPRAARVPVRQLPFACSCSTARDPSVR